MKAVKKVAQKLHKWDLCICKARGKDKLFQDWFNAKTQAEQADWFFSFISSLELVQCWLINFAEVIDTWRIVKKSAEMNKKPGH